LAGPKSIKCRQIETGDFDQVIALLTRGFRDQRRRAFWIRAMDRLAAREPPPELPRFGYLLEGDGAVVGVILLIFTSMHSDLATAAHAPPEEGAPGVNIRCSLSSWYVDEGFRGYAPMLVSRALRHKQATYINLTPARHTLPILEAQGFKRFCEGRLIAVPLLSRGSQPARIEAYSCEMTPGDDMPPAEVALLAAHAADGCVAVVCSAGGRRQPFVFAPRRKFGLRGVALLAYCRDVEAFVRFAAPLGRFLARHGIMVVIVDTNGPVAGLVGWYSPERPKYFRGPHRPRLGDLAYTERTMFGS
jgi:hypothetical protein